MFVTAASRATRKRPVLSLRSRLLSNVSLYVAATGSDKTGSGTSGKPWATLQKAMNYVAANLDITGFTVTVNVGAGTFDGFTVVSTVGGGIVRFLGAGIASTTITRDPVNTFSACLTVFTQCGSVIAIDACTLDASAAGGTQSGIYNSGNCEVNVGGTRLANGVGVKFVCGSNYPIDVDNFGSVVTMQGGNNVFSYPGGTGSGVYVAHAGRIYDRGQSLTITGNPNWTNACVLAFDDGVVEPRISMSGSATGRRFLADAGLIQSGGQSETALPGDTPGRVRDGGMYL